VNQIRDFLRSEHYEFIGISSFGPLCLDQKNPSFGYITSTPKVAYRNFPILQQIQSKTSANHYGFDTDVNAPAYAEFHLGNHDVKESLVYVTVGTGVGIGVIANKKTVHGLVHPEGGHIIVRRHPEEDPTFKGVCPYHSDCLEGLVTNNSIAARLGKDIHSLHTLDDSEKVWTLVGYYLGQLCLNLTLILSPEVILIGGGIMNRKIIFQHIYRAFPLLLNEYVDHPKLKIDQLSHYIREPKLSNVGLIGAMMLKPIVDHHGHVEHVDDKKHLKD
jgi:fructokinase